MSILNSLRDLVQGVVRPSCGVCGSPLVRGQRYICTRCMVEAPLTRFSQDAENRMAERVRSLYPRIEHASSLLYYERGSCWSGVIRRLKYHHETRHGARLGEWLGGDLARSSIYRDIDTVIAIPLHPFKQMLRGYNQADLIAEGVAHELGIRALRGVVRRRRYNTPQVTLRRDDRWRNVESLFRVSRPERLEGRNILLVDDVFTTGATILSCAEAILSATPNCRLWIATVAVSERELGVESGMK